jgi:glycosyltransferase involved in cell wall biosynthesis
LDEDLRWLAVALESRVRFTPLPLAQIVHAAWWPAVAALPARAFQGKKVVCFADNPPAFYLTRVGFAQAARRVDLWVARSREAEAQFQALGLPVIRAPYVVDPNVFRPLPQREALRSALGLPVTAFVIGNFHRDSQASDLTQPKLQKGPDLLLEVAVGLHRRRPETVVLLAGPRRHWLRKELRCEKVPCVFVGRETDGDDYPSNILKRGQLNELYQCLDLVVISSRWEGGPYAVLEAALAERPVLSTPVGIARDVLPHEQLFQSPAEAIEAALSGCAGSSVSSLRAVAMREWCPSVLCKSLLPAYGKLAPEPVRWGDQVRSAMALLSHAACDKEETHPVVADAMEQVGRPGPVLAHTSLGHPSLEEVIATARGIQSAAGRS